MQESRYLKVNADNIQKLMSVPVLKEFDTKDISELLRRSKIRKYEAKELIIKEGDSDSFLYFLLSGKVRIAKEGKELATLKRSGDIFGEIGVLGHADRSASVYAESDTVCLTTDADQINKISGKDQVAFCYLLYRVFAEALAERLRITSEELVKARQEIEQFRTIHSGPNATRTANPNSPVSVSVIR